MREYQYRVVDVFTQTPLEGNPLAVVPNATGLDAAAMQKLAREFNLSETTFIFPSDRREAAARFRIFTPTMEMRFAGHPTLGGAFVARELGLVAHDVDRFVIDEPVGPVQVRVESGASPRLWLATPPIEAGRKFEGRVCAEALGLTEQELAGPTPQLLSAGNPCIFVAVKDASSVDRACLDLTGVRRLHDGRTSTDCVFVFARTSTGAYSRMFGLEAGVVEDPATGSATGPLAAYMMQTCLLDDADGTRFVSEQGTKMGRRSFLHVEIHGRAGADGIEVGGHVVPFAEGTFRVT